MDSLSALVIDDDPEFCESMAKLVEHEGFAVHQAGSLGQGRELLASTSPDVVLIDLALPDGEGLELARDEAVGQGTAFVVVTGQGSVDTAVEALKKGALDYLTKPVDRRRLQTMLGHVRRQAALRREVDALREDLRELGRFGPLIGRSKAMQSVYDLVSRVAPTEATVFVTGESGTGKELVAQAIHELSRRRGGAAGRRELRRGHADPDRERAVRPRARQLHRRRARATSACSSRPTAARCSSTRSARCRSSCSVKLLRVLETGSLHARRRRRATSQSTCA